MNDPPLHYLGQSQDTPGAAEHPLMYLLGRASGNRIRVYRPGTW